MSLPRCILNAGWLGLLIVIGCSNGRGSLEEQQTTTSASPPSDTATSPPSSTPPPPAGTPLPPPSGTTFSISGTVNGLAGSGLVLQLNGAEDLTITSNGVFSFASRVASDTQYAVAVKASPSNPSQSCTVANGNGTVVSADVSSVRVICAGPGMFSVGGTLSGLFGSGLVLQNNGGDNINVRSNGRFEFPTTLVTGAPYSVSVRTHPSDPDQACSVSNGTGTINAANITTVAVTCKLSEFTIGGSVRGLSSGGLVLLNNGVDELRIDANGSFVFPTALPTGARYNVTIANQPTNQNQICTLSNGLGTVGSTNVTSIRVACSSGGFRIGGHVSELRGSGLVLQNNGADDLPIASNGSYWFVTTMPSGASYNVTVRTQPSNPQQTCTVKGGSGIVRNSDVQNVEVKCDKKDDDDGDD